MKKRITWVIEDHLCKFCGGRILRSVTGVGPTPAGNPVFRCADCGKSSTAMGPQEICWCGFSHRSNTENPYMCVPFSAIEEHPYLREAFWNCGCDPARGQVGIILTKEYNNNKKI